MKTNNNVNFFKRILKPTISWIYIIVIMIALYAPILYMIIWSFTDSTMGQWTGFTFDLYTKLFNTDDVKTAFMNTVVIAFSSAAFSVILGTLGSIGIFYLKRRMKTIMLFGNRLPVVTPEIVTAIGLMLLFSSAFLNISKGYTTIIISHVAFCTPFVVLNILPKLGTLNENTFEAAIDLGASPFQATIKVLLPQLIPAIISGFVLSLTLSLDDFVITQFTKGTGINTLSTYVWSVRRAGRALYPIRALSTLIFVTVLGILIGTTVFKGSKSKESAK